VTFTQAVSSVLGQYASFGGRARRAEFWWWNLFTLLVGVVVAATEMSLGIGGERSGPVSTLLAVALLVPNVSVCVRRLHDTSRSAWWLFVALVPLAGPIVLLVFFLAPSTPGWNQHGPDPRLPAAAQAPAAGVEQGGGPLPGAALAPEAPSPGWTPPGWDLPSAAEPGAGRPTQDSGPDDVPGRDRPQG